MARKPLSPARQRLANERAKATKWMNKFGDDLPSDELLSEEEKQLRGQIERERERGEELHRARNANLIGEREQAEQDLLLKPRDTRVSPSRGTFEGMRFDSIYGEPKKRKNKGRSRMSDSIKVEEELINDLDVSSGFQLEGFGNDIQAALEFAGQDLDPTIPTDLEDKATVANIQLQRIMHMSTEERLAIKAILSGDRTGISVNKSYLSHGNLDAAQAAFGSLIGEDPVAFSRRIKVEDYELASNISITQYEDDITGELMAKPLRYSAQGLVRDPKSVRTAYSMLYKTAEEYMDKGPGSSLVGNVLTPDKIAKRDKKFDITMSALDSLAELYIPEETKASNIYGLRKSQVKTELAKRLMDMDMTKGGRKEDITLPMPAELGIMGLVPNASNWSGFNSPYGRLEYDQFIAGRPELQGSMSEEDRWEIENRLFGKLKPNLRKSLFPEKAEGVGDKETSRRFARKANLRARRVRESLLEMFPTHQDESDGRKRSAGFYLTEENPNSLQYEMAQAERMSALDQLFQQGVEGDIYAGQGDLSYGQKGESLLGDLLNEEPVEQAIGIPLAPADTDLGRYQRDKINKPPPAQRSEEWFAKRRGLVTASRAAKLIGSEREQLGLVRDVAKERLGTAEEFFQNDAMMQGTKFEERVKRSFMTQVGKNLVFQEAYLETSPDFPGIGATPDGMLYDKESGEFEGLLELKLVQSKTRMAQAIKNYMPQMQTQMMVTGAHQTHLYVMNAKTEEVMHEVVQANPEMQELLRIKAFQISREAASLDMAGVEQLEEQIKSLPSGRVKKTSKELEEERAIKAARKSAEAKYTVLRDEEEVPVAYDPGRAVVKGIYTSSAGSASTTLLAEAMDKADQSEKKKAALESARGLSEQPMDQAVSLFNMHKIQQDLTRKSQEKDGAIRAANIDAERSEQEAEGAARAAAIEEQVRATGEASKSLKEFNNSVKEASKGLQLLAEGVLKGNEEGMGILRMAPKMGLEADQVKGLQQLLTKEGHLSMAEANSVIKAAGTQTKKFARMDAAAAEYGRMAEYVATSVDSDEIRQKISIPEPEVIMNMGTEERIAWAQAEINKFEDSKDRAVVSRIVGQEDLAYSKVNPDQILSASKDIREEKLEETQSGIRSWEEIRQEGMEILGSMGEVAGGASGSISNLATPLATAGASLLAAGAASKKYKEYKANKGVVNDATRTSPSSGLNKPKLSLSSGIKGVGVGSLVGLATQAGRSAFDVDEGSAVDSGLDILEMGVMGASVGSMFGPLGAVIGGGAGVLGGAAYEAYEWATKDSVADPVPDSSLGKMRAPTTDSKDKLESNVEVSVNVSPDMIRTEVNNNGYKYLDSDNSLELTGVS